MLEMSKLQVYEGHCLENFQKISINSGYGCFYKANSFDTDYKT